jgi:predicted negative regulator of RcsB-dependent stress response
MLKSIVLVAAVGLVGYVGYRYYKQQQGGCSCSDNEEQSADAVKAPMVDTEKPAAVEQYDASPRATLPTPPRLLINTRWPTDGDQTIANQ